MSQSGGVNVFTYAKQIRKPGENWQDAIKRAGHEIKGTSGKTRSECSGLAQNACVTPCHWRSASKPTKSKTGKKVVRKAYCAVAPVRSKKAKSVGQAWEASFPEY